MNEPEASGALAEGAFEGRETFRGLVRAACAAAARERWPEIIVCDVDFADWPLGEGAVVADLTAWMLGSRGRLLMLACRYDALAGGQPLFVRWRRQWSHRIECRALTGIDESDALSALWARAWGLQRHNRVLSSGTCGSDPAWRGLLAQSLQDARAASESAFPPDVLGL